MKRRTIKSVLRKKFDDLLAHVRDEKVRDLMAKNSIITGGAIASMLLGEPVSDFDVYFTDRVTAEAVARHYVTEFKKNPPPKFSDRYGGGEIPIEVRVDLEATPHRVKIVVKSAGVATEDAATGYEYFEMNPDPESTDAADYAQAATEVAADAQPDDKKPRYRPVFLSGNAISLSDKVQLVVRFYGNPDEIHENYDFVHCTCWWHSGENKLELRPAALEALLARELRYVGSKYPLCSFIRVRKFVARGWTINAGQFLKMAWHLNGLRLSDPAVLEEQLTGVDAAYFQQLIDALKTRMQETGAKSVDATYLMELVDRIF